MRTYRLEALLWRNEGDLSEKISALPIIIECCAVLYYNIIINY